MLQGIDWSAAGSLADWSTSIIALLALAVAGIAARATIQTNRAQQATFELQREQYERAQASKVSFYVDKIMLSTSTVTGGFVCNPEEPKKARIINASDSPIYSLFLVQTYPPADSPIAYIVGYLFSTGTEPVVWDLYATGDDGSVFMRSYDLHFMDANGVGWIRRQSGELIKATMKDYEYLGLMLAKAVERDERED